MFESDRALRREVVRVAWPLVVSMLSYTAMGLVDTLMVARLGTVEVAAVGLATAVYFTIGCLGLGLLGAVKILVAQAQGARDERRGRAAAWQGCLLAVAVGIVALLLVPLAEPVLRLLAGAGRVSALATTYLRIRLFGVLPHVLSVATFGWFEGRGHTRTSMWVRMAANAVNVGLDLILIFGLGPVPAMGVAGAAIATIVALWLQAGVAVWMLWLATPRERIGLDQIRPLLRIGGPMGVQWSLEVVSWTVFAGLVARFGDAHLAAHTIVVRIVSVSFLPGHAMKDAASILVGQAVGAGNPALARRAAGVTLALCLALMSALGVILAGLGPLILVPFRPAPDVALLAARVLMIAAIIQVFDAVALTRTGALAGVGDTRFVMRVSLLVAWCVLVPLAWLLCRTLGFGVTGAWSAVAVQIALISVLMTRRWARWGRPHIAVPVPVPA